MNDVPDQKRRWRSRFRAERAQLSTDQRADAATRLAAVAATLDLGPVVAAYVPIGSEPGDVRLLTALAARARVLLPLTPSEPGALDWAVYDGALVAGPYGLLEPAGPPLGIGAVRDATAIVLPALGVARTGVRLGRGAGYYDRTLGGHTGLTMAVVYDHELVDELPAEDTDVPVGAALTPSGLVLFGSP